MVEDTASSSAGRSQSTPADHDLPCPACGYNLRALPGSVCPECGLAFDPQELREQYRTGREPPSFGWIVTNMLLHPVRFWRDPRVLLTAGPSVEQMFMILALAVYAMPAVMVAWDGLRGTSPWIILLRGPTDPRGFLELLALLPMPLVGAWFLLLVHAGLSMAGMPRDVRKRAPLRFGKSVLVPHPVIGYAAAWAIPSAVLLLSSTSLLQRLPYLSLQSMMRQNLLGLMLLAGLAYSCVMWALALYNGSMAASGGRRLAAAWTVICNPFWYAVALLIPNLW